ncbi:MAG: hypothetical protein FJ271_18370 [Planctomycetes bacterium]|nr:hypothetical protein [Planctomycetota bacterium]
MRFRKMCKKLTVPLLILLSAQAAWADPCGCLSGSCGSCFSPYCRQRCQWHHCPPHLHHCTEKPPCIKFKCQCPRPTCCPCEHPNFGYYQPCWIPWPWPPDWSHCPVPPPASFIQVQPQPGPSADTTPTPSPRFDMRPGL